MESGPGSDKSRFRAVLLINLVIFIGELVIGFLSGSLAMLADSYHVLLDVIASIIAYISESDLLSLDKEKIKIWAAYINVSLFFVVAGGVIYEAIDRIKSPPVLKIDAIFFFIAIGGLIGNLYSALVLKKEKGGNYSVNRKALFWHMAFDSLGSVIVIIGAIAILRWHLYIIDPILSIVLATIISVAAVLMIGDLKSSRHH